MYMFYLNRKLFMEVERKYKGNIKEELDRKQIPEKLRKKEEQRIEIEYQERRPLDIIRIEKLLYYLDLIDKYTTELKFLKKRHESLLGNSGAQSNVASLQNIMDEKPAPGKVKLNTHFMAGIGQSLKVGKLVSLSVLQNVKMIHSGDTEFNNVSKCQTRIQELNNLIGSLVEETSNIDLYYKADEGYIEGSTQEFIPMHRYFIPTEQPTLVNDIYDKHYVFDVNVNDNPAEIFEQYDKILTFIDKKSLDRQQQKWFKRVPLKVHYLRPVNRESEGIYVPKDDRDSQVKKKNEELMNSMIYYKTIDK